MLWCYYKTKAMLFQAEKNVNYASEREKRRADMNITEKIKQKGLELGFSHVGITTADDFTEYETEVRSRPDYAMWTDDDRSKYPGRSYLSMAAQPKKYYPQGKSIICATYGYGSYVYPQELTQYVARAYLCRSYVPIDNMQAGIRIAEFKRYIQSLGIEMYEGEYELPEREACARAGIITYGKNNFAYTKEDGSFNILYTFLVDTELEYDAPTVRCDCPSGCTKCMNACPTQSILKAGRLAPKGCAMNLHQMPMGKYPEQMWDKFGTRIHGCDECQLACPRNQAVVKKAAHKDMLLEHLKSKFDLEKVLMLDEDYYEAVVKPLMFNYIRDMNIFRRNAAIALGNTGDIRHLPALHKALEMYDNAELKETIQWAINRLVGSP